MISKTDLKTIYEWAKDKDFPVRKTSVSGYYKRSYGCLLYTSPSPRDVEESRMPSSA